MTEGRFLNSDTSFLYRLDFFLQSSYKLYLADIYRFAWIGVFDRYFDSNFPPLKLSPYKQFFKDYLLSGN